MAKCSITYKRKGGKVWVWIPKRGFVLEFSSVRALRKMAKKGCIIRESKR